MPKWVELWIVQETGIKTIPLEKKFKKAKWLSGEALHIAVKRREAKSKGEKESGPCRVGTGESGLVSRGSQGLRSPLESRRGSLGAP